MGSGAARSGDVYKAESRALHVEDILCMFLSLVWGGTLALGYLHPVEEYNGCVGI